MARLIDGKATAAKVRAEVARQVSSLVARHGLTPGLAVVLVGADPASEIYVRNKGRQTREAGMRSFETGHARPPLALPPEGRAPRPGSHPATGPLLVVANHPNVVLDILVVGSAIPRDDLRFLGKSTLFRSPLLGVMLRLAGVIPVSRTQDAGEPMSANREMLRRAVSVLEENATLVVFPEGMSHAEMKVRPLRPGMARIALAAAESGSDVAIVPMGLDFTDPGTFRSDVAIHVGSPVSVVTFLASHQADRRLAEQELTALLHERLAALTRHIDDARLETLVRSLSEIYADHVAQEFEDAGELSRRLRAEQEIIRAAHYFAGREPGLIQEMSAQLRAHLRKLRLLHVHPSSIAQSI